MNLKWKDRLIISISCFPILIYSFVIVDNLISKILFVVAGIILLNATLLAYKESKKETEKGT